MFSRNIRYYRLQAGMSQEALAEKIGVKKMTICHYENGNREPSAEVLKKICDAVGISLGRFLNFQEGPISLPEGSFRKNSSLPALKQEAIKEEISQKANCYFAAVNLTGASYIDTTFPANSIPLLGNPADSATYLRSILGLASSGPIPNLIQVVENAGVVVIPVDEKDDRFSGYSCRCGNTMTLIAFNSSMSPERQRFTIAHELVHLAFSGKISEKEVDNIAGRFLVPAIDIKREIGAKRRSVGTAELKFIHDEYGVSGKCAALRVYQEGIINQSAYNAVADATFYSSSREIPSRLKQLACRAYFEGNIGIGKVAELLGVPIMEAREMCNVGVSAEW